MAIAIKGWDTLYENSETKKYKHLKWVPIPNKHDGTGWAELWNLRKAPEIFAAFIIMLEIASKCPKRGVIHKDGVSYGPKEMALKSRAPESIFVDAIPALIKIGWIEEIEISGEIRKSSEEPPANRIEQNRTEQNRKTAAAPDTASVPPHLSEVWEAFSALRKTKRQPLTKRAVDNILKTLSPFPPEVQVAMIDQSITNGWTGIFPLKPNRADPTANMRKL